MNDPYVLPDGVLRNRLGITDAAALAAAEADITRARLLQVDRHAPPGDFDLDHLRRFHAAIFWRTQIPRAFGYAPPPGRRRGCSASVTLTTATGHNP